MSRLLDAYGDDVPPDVLNRIVEALAPAAASPDLYPEVAAQVWSTLGFTLKYRFMLDLRGTGGTQDLDLAIKFYRGALGLLPPPGPYSLWGNLAQAYLARCVKRPDDAAAARDAVFAHARALDVLTLDDPAFGPALNAAAFLLRAAFVQLKGDLGLIGLADSFRRARDEAPAGSAVQRACALAHAETLLVLRRRGEPVPPVVEVSAWLEVFATEEPGDDRGRDALYFLGKELLVRYGTGGSAADLDLAVVALSKATEKASADADFTGMLGHALRLRAERDRPDPGDDLDVGVAAMRATLRTAAPGEEWEAAAAQLAGMLLQRFRATRQREDLDEAIVLSQRVRDGKGLKVAADAPAAQHLAVSTAIRALTLRADLDDSSADATIAFMLRHYNPDADTAADPARPVGDLKRVLHEGYTVLAAKRKAHTHPDSQLADEADQEIAWLQQALRGEISDAQRRKYRKDLIDALTGRHIAVPDAGVLDEIITHQSALLGEMSAELGVHRAAHRLGLALALYQRFEADNSREADFDAAVEQARPVAGDPAVTTEVRFRAAILLGDFGGRVERWAVADEGFRRAVALLPRLVGRQLSPDDHLRELSRWSDLASDAASAAVRAGAPGRALELLEQGRGLLIGRALDARADFDEILAADPRQGPQLVADLRRIGDELAVSAPGHGTTHAGDHSDVDRRQALVREWDSTVDRIRRLPGCADFLAPATLAQLLPAAAGGPVVTINISRFGSDALVLTPAGVTAVPLPGLTPDAVRDQVATFHDALPFAELSPADPDMTRAAQEPLNAVLSWLWHHVTGPVLDHLGPPPPRIWWVPTGELAALPLHAAGVDGGPSVLDATVSSYTPTVKSLLAAARRPASGETTRVQLVGIRATLAGVNAEMDRILARFPHARHIFDDEATRDRVRDTLRDTEWLHVACHAISYPNHPADSALHLHDGPLTVRRLLAGRAPHGRLAYLSACQTVLTSASASAEVIHLGTALHAAGFQHVVGTLWSIPDGTAAETARLFYEAIGDRPDASRSPVALHRAGQELRRRYPGMPARWAAYAHFGP